MDPLTIWAGARAFLGAQLWKLTTAAGVIGCVVLTGYLIAARVENGHLTADNEALTASINDPATGYAARIAQCRVNTLTYEDAVKQQNVAVDAQAARDKTALDAAEAALTASRDRVAKLQAQAAVTLAYKPSGANACERSQDVIDNYFKRQGVSLPAVEKLK